jgi:hypothetical protein
VARSAPERLPAYGTIRSGVLGLAVVGAITANNYRTLINITNGKMESTFTLLCFGSDGEARINAQYVVP